MSLNGISQGEQHREFFVLPETKMAVNNADLTSIQKRILANHYEKQMRERNAQQVSNRRKSSLNTPLTTPSNPESHNPSSLSPREQQLSFFQLNQMQRDQERIMRMQLAQEYQAEIERKEQQKRIEAQYRKRENAAYAEGMKIMSDLEAEKTNRIYAMNRNNMRDQLDVAERQRQEKMEMKRKEQQVFNERYGKIPRSSSLKNMEQSTKLDQFRQHYEKINHIQKEIQNNYIQNWSPLIHKKQQEKDKLIYAGIVKNNELLNRKSHERSEQEHRLQQDLKSTLIRQMMEREKSKEERMKETRNEHYTTNEYRNVYHPICNPVDFKVNHDNKYVLREIKQEQELQDRSTGSTGSDGLSGLARNGSYALLSK